MSGRVVLGLLALLYLFPRTAMLLKAGVSWKPSLRLALALPIIADVYRRVVGGDFMITSGNDGEHGEGSLHYRSTSGVPGEHDALDLRTKYLTLEQEDKLGAELRAALGPHYDVIWTPYRSAGATRHMHVEYDPR